MYENSKSEAGWRVEKVKTPLIPWKQTLLAISKAK